MCTCSIFDIFKCSSVKIVTVDSDDFIHAPQNVLCPYCSKLTNPIYKIDQSTYTFCCYDFPLNDSDRYLVCKSCNSNIGKSAIFKCEDCNIRTVICTNFCVGCGKPMK